jgi:hypothetical protein
MRWLQEHRGFTLETIAGFSIGWDGQRVTIPVYDADGILVNVRRYMRDAKDTQGKMLPLVTGSDAATRLFPIMDPLPEEVVLVEGEWDAILMHQHGFPNTLTVTSGAGIFKAEWIPLFEGRKVVICYDNDEAGRKGGQRVAAQLAKVAEVRILYIPNLPAKGDVTDFFVEQSRSEDELRELLAEATPYAVTPLQAAEEGEPRLVQLHEASDARYRGQRLELPILLSGKSMTPFMVPYKFRVHCDMSNKRLCPICPLAEVAGDREVVLAASDPAVLSLVNVTGESQAKALKQLARAIPSCPRPQVEIHESINVEEVRLIPELDARTEAGGDTEYVSRTGYALMHGLLPNRGYRMVGYSHPHPKTQATVHLISEAIPAQDNISAFSTSDELHESLKVFQVGTSVAAKFEDIYTDLAANVHRILDRFDMQIAYDLTWHSVIGFTFNGALVRRGWVETMVMGDSGQGKTEMAMELLRHYRLGERVQGEQSSSAGLIGGLEKMGDTWLLSWGRIPLNDKRLLIIDEAQGLAPQQVEGMSDVRATGIAEITKIRTERTSARCRIVWLANPVDGMTLAQHNQGVLAFGRLFKKPEDIRRLDFAICVASGDVDFASSINVHHAAPVPPRYSSDLCRKLILWAWSRRTDQTIFTEEATKAILAAATDMGVRFHSSIPLVEPADQRLKIARLAVAAAARVYSTEDGERVIVKPEHVAFVVDYLERVYDSPAMSYGEYSAGMKSAEELPAATVAAVQKDILEWPHSEEAVAFLRTSTRFRKSDLVDAIGWDDAFARLQLQMMTRYRLVKSVRDGYVKQPAFIDLLRKVAGERRLEELAEVGAEDPF